MKVNFIPIQEDAAEMEISITAVTRNRKFTKFLIRHAEVLGPLKRLAVGIDNTALRFDVLQLVFLDRSPSYVKPVGRKGDRLFQVEVSVPDEETVDYGSPSAFVASIAERLNSAIKLCGLPRDTASHLSEAFAQFRKDVNGSSSN